MNYSSILFQVYTISCATGLVDHAFFISLFFLLSQKLDSIIKNLVLHNLEKVRKEGSLGIKDKAYGERGREKNIHLILTERLITN